MRFVLASESARRVDLLRAAGYDFEARRSGFPEVSLPDPKETAETNARGKALAVSGGTDSVVLGADTVVYLPGGPAAGRVLGQAEDGDDVRRMLRSLRGRPHEVYSGVAVARGGGLLVGSAVTRVRMRDVGDGEVESYVRLGEGVGKAGGYAIQGRAGAFIEWIGGDYTNVVGLPLAMTGRMLARFGIPQP
ncbi:MAG TPA: Maf family protein [Rubrobacter sp.]|nr:Maf family protein [Rubrobacter sp.]